MAGRLLKVPAVSFALALIGVVPLIAQAQQILDPTRQDTRISFLLVQLADQSRLSDDLAFAVRAQSQAALLLWPRDRARAQVIFRRAFESLAPNASFVRRAYRCNFSAAEKRQLRTELLNQIASRDSELAEELARVLADSVERATESSSEGRAADDCEQLDRAAIPNVYTSARREEIERRELLVSVALHVVERDPQRAMTLGQMSLAFGISPHFAQLIVLMRATDAVLADLLFSSALARLERKTVVDLVDVHSLGSYVVSASDSSARDPLPSPLVKRFLDLAFNRITNRGNQNKAASQASDEATIVYLVGRQLTGLFARYSPDKLARFNSRLGDQAETTASDRVIESSLPQVSGPVDIARQAREVADERERDSLYARAAMAWLAGRDVNEAAAAAAKISNAEMRDRVLTQIARRQTSEGRIDDAIAVASHIKDENARVNVLIRLAGAALAANDRVRATELLNDAEREALKARPSIARANALLTIVGSFSGFDTLRGFEVMQTAVKSINEISSPSEEAKQSASSPAQAKADALKSDEVYGLNFESTLSVLARVDFDRALILAQQLTGKEAAVIAQLAVCRGGLTHTLSKEQAADEAGENH